STDPSSMLDSTTPLPEVLAGPLLRRLEPGRLLFWLVASRPLSLQLELHPQAHAVRHLLLKPQVLGIGTHAFLHLIDVALEEPLPQDQIIGYDLLIDTDGR